MNFQWHLYGYQTDYRSLKDPKQKKRCSVSGCHRDTVIIYYNAFFFSVILMMGSLLKGWVAQQAPDLN